VYTINISYVNTSTRTTNHVGGHWSRGVGHGATTFSRGVTVSDGHISDVVPRYCSLEFSALFFDRDFLYPR